MSRRDEETAPPAPDGERNFRLLVESVSDYAIFLLDPSGRVVTWNRGAQKIKGWSADEIIGHSFERFYPPEAVARGWPQQELKLAAELGRYEDEGWRLRKDGSVFWADVVITAMFDPSGRLDGFAKVTRDLTERRAAVESLRRSEERLRLLVDGVDDAALYLLDPTGHVSTWNSGAQRIKGYSAAEIIGQDYACFYTPEDREGGKPARHLEQARRHGQVHDDGWRLRKDGTRFWAHTVLTALRDRDGAPLGFAKVTKDRSDVKRVQALEESRQQVNEFLAMLSHELRNPLAPIRNAIDLLQLVGGRDPDEVEARNVIDRQSAQLARLVDDLLDVSRITSGKFVLRRERVDVREVVERAIESSRPFLDARRHRLVKDLPQEPLLLEGDMTRLAQVLLNLLNNSAKFTPPGGHVRIAARAVDGQCLLSVSDDGCGIHADILPRIFEPFVQGERGLDRAEGGLGLGLALVRTLVEAHGGNVQARSAGTGLGAEFIVRLPLSGASASSPSAPPVHAALGPARRILVVDDNRDSADGMALLLRRNGHSVRVAYDGPQALACYEDFAPDAVLLDIGLPGMTGLEVANGLRERQRGRRLLLLAVTGYGQDNDRRRSREAGFDGHLVKPVAASALMSALEAH